MRFNSGRLNADFFQIFFFFFLETLYSQVYAANLTKDDKEISKLLCEFRIEADLFYRMTFDKMMKCKYFCT